MKTLTRRRFICLSWAE